MPNFACKLNGLKEDILNLIPIYVPIYIFAAAWRMNQFDYNKNYNNLSRNGGNFKELLIFWGKECNDCLGVHWHFACSIIYSILIISGGQYLHGSECPLLKDSSIPGRK